MRNKNVLFHVFIFHIYIYIYITNNYITHIFPNISTGGNQALKFSRLMEYLRKPFLEKLCTKCSGEASPRLFFSIEKFF